MATRKKLTKQTVDALCVTGAEQSVTDTQIAGFYVRVSPAGQKSYGFRYKRGNRTRRHRIGDASLMTATEARAEARRLRVEVDAGGDPAKDRQEERKAETVSQLWDHYLERHAKLHKGDRSVKEDKGLWKRNIKTHLATTAVKDVRRADIEKIMRAKKDRPVDANRTLSLLSKMFRLAEDWNVIAKNPCKGVQRFKEYAREVEPLTPQQVKALEESIDEEVRTGDPGAAFAFEFLLKTGARISEALRAKWSEFSRNAEGRVVWTLTAEDTKQDSTNRKVLLTELAERLSEWREEVDNEADTDWVFPSRRHPQQKRADIKKPWKRITERAGLAGLTAHDLRHNFIGRLVADGVPLELVRQYAGHKSITTTMRYAHLGDDTMAAVADRAGDAFQQARESEEAATVVPFRKQSS